MHHNPLRVQYDTAVDVLHLMVGKPQGYEGNGVALGVELDYSIDTGKPCGAKVIGFHRYGWDKKLPDLSTILKHHLRLSEKGISSAIENAIDDARLNAF